MNALLERIDTGELLRRLPSNVRGSLEAFIRADTDWNGVGDLLAGTPMTGVMVSGTGQWTGDLWQAVKWEFRSFLCSESEAYAELRTAWPELSRRSSALAVGSLETLIAARVGVTSGVIAPLITWLLVATRRTHGDDLCRMLSAAPGAGAVLQSSTE